MKHESAEVQKYTINVKGWRRDERRVKHDACDEHTSDRHCEPSTRSEWDAHGGEAICVEQCERPPVHRFGHKEQVPAEIIASTCSEVT